MNISWPFSLIAKPDKRPKKKASLKNAISGRMLTAIYVEGSNLYLRLSDAIVTINLDTREYRFGGRRPDDFWIVPFGWLRISRLLEEQSQIILEVAGSLYSARIYVRFAENRWFISFAGGRGLAST